MRILVLSQFYPPDYIGGFELSCAEFVGDLEASGDAVTVLTCESPSLQIGPEQNVRRTGRRIQLFDQVQPRPKLPYSLWNALEVGAVSALNEELIARTVRETSTELVVAFGVDRIGLSWPARLPSDLPVLWNIGDFAIPQWFQFRNNLDRYSQLNFPGKLPPNQKERLIYQWAFRRTARNERATRFRYMSFASAFMEGSFRKSGFPMEESFVVPRGIDFDHPTDPASQRPIDFLFVGRICEEKGIELFIDSMAELCAELEPGARLPSLCVAGGGEESYIHAMKQRALQQGLDHLDWAGKLTPEQALAKMQQSKCFVSCSLWQEPFGRTNVEAIAAGCLLIGTDVGAIREIVPESLWKDVLVEPSSSAMVPRLKRALSDTHWRVDSATQSYQFAKQKFSRSAVRAATNAMVEHIVSISSGGKP